MLLAASAAELRAMLRVVDRYGKKWRFSFNAGKCGVMVSAGPGLLRARRELQTHRFSLSGNRLPAVRAYKYLGIEIVESRAGGTWNTFLDRIHKNTTKAANLTLLKAGYSSGFRSRTLLHLWKTECRPLLEYGAEIWSGAISKSWMGKLEALQNKFMSLDLPGKPATVGMRTELNQTPVCSRFEAARLRYWNKLCNTPRHRRLALIFRGRHSETLAQTAPRSCLKAYSATLRRVGCDAAWLRCSANNLVDVTERLQRSVMASETKLTGQRSTLALYRALGHSAADGFPLYLDDTFNREGVRLKVVLRGCMNLLCDLIISHAECIVCRGGIEDPAHFTRICYALGRSAAGSGVYSSRTFHGLAPLASISSSS